MTPLDAALVLLAGVGAGTLNAVVGSGTLVSFPVLLAVGLPPVTANITNNIGLVPGSVGGAWGYRRELRGQRRRVLVMGVASALGGLTGAVLLLVLPAEVFRTVVPVLVVLALVLVIVQPRLTRAVQRRRERLARPPRPADAVPPAAPLAALTTGVYGGYFGAAQGILLLALTGLILEDELQRLNALKNVLSGLVNAVATVLFTVLWALGRAPVEWSAVAVLAVGALAGGLFGGRVGRLLPPTALRVVIVVVGLVAVVQLLNQ